MSFESLDDFLRLQIPDEHFVVLRPADNPLKKEELAETERMVELVREHQLKLRAEQDREFEGFD